NTNLTRCIFILVFSSLAALVSGQESAVKTSPRSKLLETESENATRMLQLRWRFKPTDSGFWEELFWFAESRPPHGEQTMAKDDSFIVDRRIRMTEADGMDFSSHIEITVVEITTTQIVIKVHCTRTLRSGEKSVKELDEVIKVPLRNIGPTTQGKAEFIARWWDLAQPSSPPEPPVGRE
ncbi:MAG: hypothetical protein ACYC6Y_31530, partial [Thermoguttaceae bacterium]